MVQVLILIFSAFTYAASDDVSAVINFQNDTVHLELSGKSNWKYDLNRSDKQVTLEMDSLSNDAARSLQNFKSDLVKSVVVKKSTASGRDTVVFALKNANIEHFDYLTDEPSRLILDFYVNPEAKKVSKKEVVETSKKQKRNVASDAVVVANNGPLNVDTNSARYGLFDSADPGFDRFNIQDYEVKEESIIKSRDRFYIHFPWLMREPQKWNEVLESGVVYHIKPSTSDENKQMRLLEKLFEKNRNNVFLQTVEWFREKFPRSEYNEMIDFMIADTRWKMYQESQKAEDFGSAIQAYKNAILNHPKSQMTEKLSLQVAIRLFESKDYLSALRSFNQHVENKVMPTNSELSRDLARLGVGLSYMHLKKFTEAEETLRELEKKTAYDEIRYEAAYHLGDLFVLSKQYAKAIEEYDKSQTKYANVQNKFPNSYFNKAEASFWLGNYKKSLDDFREYVKRFPADDHAPFALTRLGETLEILGADKSRVMGAYLETYFRYGESLNAVIARIRMTAARMKTMKPKEVELATQEIFELSKKVNFEDVDKLSTILISEGYNERGEYDKTIDMLIKFYQKNPTMGQADQFTKRIVANINEKIRELVDKKDFIKALKAHQKYSEVWLKNSDRLDTRYFMGESFEMAGVPKEAEKYYREVLNRLLAIEGSAKEKEIRIVQHIPSKEAIYLRLAKAQSAQSKLQESYESLRQIRSIDSLNEEEQIERVILSTRLLIEKEQYDSARRFVMELLKTWKGEPSKLEAPYYRLAEIEMKTGQNKEALQSLKKIDEIYKDTKNSTDDFHFKSFEKRMEIAGLMKSDSEAIEAATQMLEYYEDTRPLASIRYKLGQIYAKQGKIKKAEETWSSFKGAQADFWQKLAQEQIQNSNWRDDYKKYINRIPAMSKESTN